jgi:hypothetical protein
MHGLRHPFSGALYEPLDDGKVLVSLDGTSGVFARNGRWISGDLREADAHLCGWVGGPKVTHHRLEVPDSDL